MERCYNTLRLAHALARKACGSEVGLFLMADAVAAARKGQVTPDGYYNVERMLKRVIAAEGEVTLCGTCMDARGLSAEAMLDGARRSTMDEPAEAVAAADKAMVF